MLVGNPWQQHLAYESLHTDKMLPPMPVLPWPRVVGRGALVPSDSGQLTLGSKVVPLNDEQIHTMYSSNQMQSNNAIPTYARELTHPMHSRRSNGDMADTVSENG